MPTTVSKEQDEAVEAVPRGPRRLQPESAGLAAGQGQDHHVEPAAGHDVVQPGEPAEQHQRVVAQGRVQGDAAHGPQVDPVAGDDVGPRGRRLRLAGERHDGVDHHPVIVDRQAEGGQGVDPAVEVRHDSRQRPERERHQEHSAGNAAGPTRLSFRSLHLDLDPLRFAPPRLWRSGALRSTTRVAPADRPAGPRCRQVGSTRAGGRTPPTGRGRSPLSVSVLCRSRLFFTVCAVTMQ